uniref:UDENN domain-containing protein n=2 Tax=Auxenochlorella protothecoides TaxID=3075 RepID=A0A1D2AA03_AUXPR
MEGNANKGILKPVIAATITDPAKLATKMAKRLFQNGSEAPMPRNHDPAQIIDEKRAWGRRSRLQHTTASDHLFEHFVVVGLPPDLDVRAVTSNARTFQRLRSASQQPGMRVTPDAPREAWGLAHHGQRGPHLDPAVLHATPSGLDPALTAALPGLCFPQGIRPELLERTPSMSELTEVVCGQAHHSSDEATFVFTLKVSARHAPAEHPQTLWGVCCYMRELVHRPPAILRGGAPAPAQPPLPRYLVAAPRCYCLLSHFPFFSLHFRVLQTVLGLERLDRMTVLAAELAGDAELAFLTPSVPGTPRTAAGPGSDLSLASSARSSLTSLSENLSGPTPYFTAAPEARPRQEPRSSRDIAGTAAAGAERMASVRRALDVALAKEGGNGPSPLVGGRRGSAAEPGLDRGARASTALPGVAANPPSPFARAPGQEPAGSAERLSSHALEMPSTSASSVREDSPEPGKGDAGDDKEGKGGAETPVGDACVSVTVAAGQQVLVAAATPSGQEPSSAPARQPRLSRAASSRTQTPGQSRSQSRRQSNEDGASESESFASAASSLAPAATPVSRACVAAATPALPEEPARSAGDDTLGTPSPDKASGQAPELSASTPQQEGTPPQTLARGDVFSPQPRGPVPYSVDSESAAGATLPILTVEGRAADPGKPLTPADLLQAYWASPVPALGQCFEFKPDPALQKLSYRRSGLVRAQRASGLHAAPAALADLEAAENLGSWVIPALCRCMSLDSILTFLGAALQEAQMVVFCPNLGLLSAVVLSLVPLLLPFGWQSLLLPVMPYPRSRLDLLDAPVPFVAGIQYKTPEVWARCGALVRVNVYKDRVSNAGRLAPLPSRATLAEALAGTYAELSALGRTPAARARPAHQVSDAQAALAGVFLSTVQTYLRSLVSDLRAYTITDVSASQERTSILLRESFIESVPAKDRAFMTAFSETQMFAVYTDAVLAGAGT